MRLNFYKIDILYRRKYGFMDKIDFVLPWVDGQGRQRQAEKRRYAGVENAADGDAKDDCRYRDFGLLRYSRRLRGGMFPYGRFENFTKDCFEV